MLKTILHFLKETIFFLLKCIGIAVAKLIILCGDVLCSIGNELEKKLK